MPVFYLSLDVVTAIKEANQGFAHEMEPYVPCSHDVDCQDISDLTDDVRRGAAGVDESVLSAAWFAQLAAGTRPPQWGMVKELLSRGATGALVPSYAPGATVANRNLVLWHWGPSLPRRIEIFDPSGRLPNNQLSWE